MHVQNTVLSGLLVAARCLQASAGSLNNEPVIARRGLDIEEQLRQHAEEMVRYYGKRQEPATPPPQSGSASSFDPNQWETQTESACEQALQALNGQASNPTGMAACYNLPFLDNKTGVFEAEVRLYNISAPIDPWVGVQLTDISMTLSYLGATVQMSNGTFQKRDMTSWPPVKEREVELVDRQAATTTTMSVPKPSNEIKVLQYVGKINSNLMGSAMSNAQLQPLLIPTIQLSANSPSTHGQVQAVLSSTEASFVSGVFAKQATTTTGPASAASASSLAATATPYHLPGLSLGVPPIGLVVTLAWTGLFALTVGLGTIGRIRFRDNYRRRIKLDQARNVQTF